MTKKFNIEISSEYPVDENRKEEIQLKEWCSDIYVSVDGRKINFEFISSRRLCQEMAYGFSRDGYFKIDGMLVVLPEISYEIIVETIERMAESGMLPGPAQVAY